MTYKVIRTDTADVQIRRIILGIAETFGTTVALEKLGEMEHDIMALADTPRMGSEPRYPVLRRMGYRVLILEKNLVFYRINDDRREVTIYAVVDQRQDYINILRGL